MSAAYLLDADICIYAMSRKIPALSARFDRLVPGEAVVCAIAYGELLFGASKSKSSDVVGVQLAALTRIAAVAPLPLEAAGHYADIRRRLEAAGTPIGNNDIWIAAHARAAGLVLVTNNEREFRRVPELEVENWAGAGVRESAPAYRRRRRSKAAGLSMEDVPPVDPVADLGLD